MRRHAPKWLVVTAAIGFGVAALSGTAWIIPDTAPASDFALIETHVLHVLRGWQPVGMYSRFGGHHPGPLYFQALAPIYLLSGYRHLAIVLTVAALNVGVLIALLWILKRHGTKSAILLTTALVLGVFFVRVDGLLASIWNPHVAIVPLALLLVCAAAACTGALRLVPVTVVVASFVIQAHFAFAVPAVAIILTAVILGIRLARSQTAEIGGRRPFVRSLLVAGGLGLLLWAIPLSDEMRPGGHHNLQRLYSFLQSREPHDRRVASRGFEHLIVAPFTPGLRLWDTPLPTKSEVRPLVWVQAGLLLMAVFSAHRRRHRLETNLGLVIIVSSLVALFAIRRIPERIEVHTVFWVCVFGVMSWSLILAELLFPLAEKLERMRRFHSAVLRGTVAATLLLAILLSVRGITDRRAEDAGDSRLVMGLTSLVRARIAEARDRHPHIHVPPSFWGVATGVVHQLYRGDIRPSVDADRIGMFGRPFTPSGRERVTIEFARGEEDAKELSKRSDYRLLGTIDGYSVYSVEGVTSK